MSHCKHCGASATQFIKLKSTESLALCLDCYNSWYCEKAGYDFALYSHPKTIQVHGKRYKLIKRAFFGGMQYCPNRSTRVDQLLKTLSETLGMPWRSIEEFDSDALVGAVERVVIKPDGVDVVMKYRQAANG